MHFNVISLFPDLIKSYFEFSIVKRAKDAGVITIDTINPRDFSTSKHKKVDYYAKSKQKRKTKSPWVKHY